MEQFTHGSYSRVAPARRQGQSVGPRQGAPTPSHAYSQPVMEARRAQSNRTIRWFCKKVQKQRAAIESARMEVELATLEIEKLKGKLEIAQREKATLEGQMFKSMDVFCSETDAVLVCVAKRSETRARRLRAALHPDGLDPDLSRDVKRVRDKLNL